MSGAVRCLGPPTRIAEQLRDTIADEQGITCSVGVASTKFVAKLASALAKPDGLIVVPRDETVSFLHQLPVGMRLSATRRRSTCTAWGCGRGRSGAHPTRDPPARPRDVSPGAICTTWPGGGPRAVVPERREKSIGADETFAHDIDDPVRIHRELLRLSDRTAARARSAGMAGRTISIKVRFSDFTTITRSKTLRHHTDVSREIFATARELFDRLGLQRARIRLVGVRLEGLVPATAAPIHQHWTSQSTVARGRSGRGPCQRPFRRWGCATSEPDTGSGGRRRAYQFTGRPRDLS